MLAACHLLAGRPNAWLAQFVEDGPGATVGYVDWETGEVRPYRLIEVANLPDGPYLAVESRSGNRLYLHPSDCVPAQVLAQGTSWDRVLAFPKWRERVSGALERASGRVREVAGGLWSRVRDATLRVERAVSERWAEVRSRVAAVPGAVGERVAAVREAAARVPSRAAVAVAGGLRNVLERAAYRLGEVEAAHSERLGVAVYVAPPGACPGSSAVKAGRVGVFVPVIEGPAGGFVFSADGKLEKVPAGQWRRAAQVRDGSLECDVAPSAAAAAPDAAARLREMKQNLMEVG